MSLAVVFARASHGIHTPLVSVEVHLSNGLPSMSIVGLADTEVKESKDRVRSAIINSHFDFPAQRITINLAPADLPKQGARLDLAIAIGILVASRQVEVTHLENFEFIGELALTGEIRAVPAVLPTAIATRQSHRQLILPTANQSEAQLINNAEQYATNHLLNVCAHLNGSKKLNPLLKQSSVKSFPISDDMAEVRGQPHARRAFEIAAAGSHSLIMIGPPGTGKTMLAKRLAGILPEMTEDEALEAAAVMSICGQAPSEQNWKQRSFRAPHHTASAVALVGGGSQPRPGEISLAHNGVLFLDEIAEFSRHVLEVLREPLESGVINISRAARQAEFPARFQLIAAMNPCPCGYLGDPNGKCHCSPDKINRYRGKISGPLLDRIDMHIEVPRMQYSTLHELKKGEASDVIRQRVVAARTIQLKRNQSTNQALSNKQIEHYCQINKQDSKMLEKAIERLGLSARAWHRILKLSRTIADLDHSDNIKTHHLQEAIGYRRLDRSG